MITKPHQKAVHFYESRFFLGGIFAVGVLLRLVQYLSNRDLWLDETKMARNLLSKSMAELFLEPLGFNQAAPTGFVLVEKAMMTIFGSTEYVLRFFPLLCGILALFLFYKVAVHFLSRNAAMIGLALFSISETLIYYSSEVKQYSSDVMFTLLILLLALWVNERKRSALPMVAFALAGALLVWFSYTATFILAGAGTVLLVASAAQRDWRRVLCLLGVCSVWLASFAAFYGLTLVEVGRNEALSFSWGSKKSFMPFPPKSASDLLWLPNMFMVFFSATLKLSPEGLALLGITIGGLAMLRENREPFFLLSTPVLFTLLASALGKYPFYGRLLLFLAPVAFLYLGKGIVYLIEKTSLKPALVGMPLIGILFLNPVVNAGHRLMKPKLHEEIKPVLQYLKEHWQAGDHLYLYTNARPAYSYYAGQFGFQPTKFVKFDRFRDDWTRMVKAAEGLRGKQRAWILFCHVQETAHGDERHIFLYHLNHYGKMIQSFESFDAYVYLYDFSQ